MPKLALQGVEINYVVRGEGQDWLVLIGGLVSAYWQAWEKYLPALTERYKVLALDSRGCAGSSSPDHPYTTRMMAADVIGVMDHLQIDRARFLGRSLGGCVAQVIAIEHPERVRSLVMTSTFAKLGGRGNAITSHWVDTVQKLGFAKFFEYLMTYFYTEEFYAAHRSDLEKYVAGLAAVPRTLHGFVNTAHAVCDHDVMGRLGSIAAPTLLMCGEEDVVTPARHTIEMGRRISGSQVQVIPRSSHGFLNEHPESFGMIQGFLAAN